MHAIEVLKEDHARIEALLEELYRADGVSDGRIFGRLERDLVVHTIAEDNVFLPQVQEAIEDSERAGEFSDERAGSPAGALELIAASYENHRAVRTLLQSVRDAPTLEQTEELREAVRLQGDLEERLFLEAEMVLEKEDFERIGDLIEHCKWQVRGLAQARLAASASFRPPTGRPLLQESRRE